jgi:hypothetical protein
MESDFNEPSFADVGYEASRAAWVIKLDSVVPQLNICKKELL